MIRTITSFLLVFISIVCLSSCIKKNTPKLITIKKQTPAKPKVVRPIIPQFHFKVDGGDPIYIDSVFASMGKVYSSVFPNGTTSISVIAYKEDRRLLQFDFYPKIDSQNVA